MSSETETVPELHFAAGLPGFPDARRFALVYWGDDTDSAFSILTSLEQDGLEFLVVPPVMFFPLYAPEIDDATVERLGIETADDALLLVIVNVPGDDPSKATANLLAPIVVNRHTREAVQAVLADGEYEIHAPLLQD
jgi:flagellar assembly factor FliW